VSKALSLKKGKRDITLIDPRLEGLSQIEPWPNESNTQMGVFCDDLDPYTPKQEMIVPKSVYFDTSKIMTLVLPRLIINYWRSQNIEGEFDYL
jgi:hypothetical protein